MTLLRLHGERRVAGVIKSLAPLLRSRASSVSLVRSNIFCHPFDDDKLWCARI